MILLDLDSVTAIADPTIAFVENAAPKLTQAHVIYIYIVSIDASIMA